LGISAKPCWSGVFNNSKSLVLGLPKHFGGVSGGGVWRVWLFCSPETGEIDWKFNFHGVAFYQLGIGENPTTIRCHGPESVMAVLGTV
jgi:hypothetical protein